MSDASGTPSHGLGYEGKSILKVPDENFSIIPQMREQQTPESRPKNGFTVKW